MNVEAETAHAATLAAQAAIETHNSAFDLESDGGPRQDLFHLLVSLLDWSDAQSPRVDFDAMLSEARDHLAYRTTS